MVQKLFPFARRETPQPDIDASSDEIHFSSQLMLWNHPDVDGLEETIK